MTHGQEEGQLPDWAMSQSAPVLVVRTVLDLRLIPPMAMLLTRCERDWVDDVRARRRHVHRERS